MSAPKTASQRGKANRDKGKRWERAVAEKLREAMPGAQIRRGYQSRAGDDEADVVCPIFWPECKVGSIPNPRAALRQAKEACTPGSLPVAFIKDDRCEPFVALSLDDFLEIVAQWWKGMMR